MSSIRLGKPLTRKGGALTPLIKKLLEASLEGEMAHHLSNDSTVANRRNGKSCKTLRTSSGSFDLVTPRYRTGSFEPQIVKKRQTSLHPELETKILSMFSSGMSYKSIAAHMEEIYGHKVSAAEISAITDTLLPVINEWRNRPLASVYPIVFMDGMFFKVKEDVKYVSNCLYALLGIDQDGKKVYGFVLAMLASISDRYYIRSNRESGLGRYDVLLIPKEGAISILLEFKHVRKEEALENSARSALEQIQTQAYCTELLYYPYVKEVVEVGIAFSGKSALAAYTTYDLTHKQATSVALTEKYGEES